MIKWALRKAIGKFEQEWKYDGSYMGDIIDASPRAAWLYSRAAALDSCGPMSSSSHRLPPALPP